jgi:sporulation protein YunB
MFSGIAPFMQRANASRYVGLLSKYHNHSRILAHAELMIQSLNLCPQCQADDMQTYGFFYYRRRFDRKILVRSLCVTFIALILTGVLLAFSLMHPLLERLATTRVSNTVNRIVIEAVDESIQSGSIRYDKLISLEKDNEGKITAVHSNMAAFNRLQAEILDIILARIDQVSARELGIPIGTLTGSALLAVRGPRISVRMESVGSSSARFQNEFDSAGINQTRHQIVLYIDVSVTILLPGFATATKVSNAVTVAETVIVGSVPETYTYFSTVPETYEEDLKDYILNNS